MGLSSWLSIPKKLLTCSGEKAYKEVINGAMYGVPVGDVPHSPHLHEVMVQSLPTDRHSQETELNRLSCVTAAPPYQLLIPPAAKGQKMIHSKESDL